METAYTQTIMDATGCSLGQAEQIEDIMRHVRISQWTRKRL